LPITFLSPLKVINYLFYLLLPQKERSTILVDSPEKIMIEQVQPFEKVNFLCNFFLPQKSNQKVSIRKLSEPTFVFFCPAGYRSKLHSDTFPKTLWFWIKRHA